MVVIIVALAPVAALVLYIYHKDRYEKEPFGVLEKAFFFGVLSAVAAIFLEGITWAFFKHSASPVFRNMVKAFLIAGLIEEWCKFSVFRRIIYKDRNFNEPFDGILYAVMISLGFAALENLAYVAGAFLKSGSIGMVGVGVIRALFAVPAHASFGVIMGYYLGLARFAKTKADERKFLIASLMIPAFLHGLYDFFLFFNTKIGLLMMVVVFYSCWNFSRKAIRIQEEKSPFKT